MSEEKKLLSEAPSTAQTTDSSSSSSISSITSGKGSSSLKAIVIGATGAVGKEIVMTLLTNPDVESVCVYARRATGIKSTSKLTEKVVDLGELKVSDFQGANVVFCSLGTTIKKAKTEDKFLKVDYYLLCDIARLAKEAGVAHFSLVSSVGADASSSLFYLATKGRTEEEIKKMQFSRFSVFRPGVLDADREESRCGECCGIFMMRYICCLCMCCCSQYNPISVRAVANAMVKNALVSATGTQLFDGSHEIEKILKS
eukprot:TRINITY_DN6406_c0_g1_i1.p1 TRINITY_DN6406_c0_g1~~TRINITY_DN6406_c0_g1_i1.p1  ORF type:complete len:264 (-),score=47.34 TRINITY_DN6406_c0_g1_i1:179-949(-)